jgi:hypothetical protein
MFEPAHGSASGIAGTGTANPATAILAGTLMLRHLRFAAEAGAVESAVAGAMQAGECIADAGGSLSTREAAIAQRLGRGHYPPITATMRSLTDAVSADMIAYRAHLGCDGFQTPR